jgi:Cu(I)/Ag(I) efflux system membrane fusion protein
VVSARVAGWIDKLHVKYRYQPVQQGQKLMDLYSRELVTEQENYLFLTRQEPKDPTMLAAAGKRLTLLGLTEEQVADLRRTGVVSRAITVYSPRAGHLHEGAGAASNAATGPMPMAGSESRELTLREGGYVEKGQTVFSIYGTRTLIAQLSMHPSDGQDRISIGQKVTVRIEGDASSTVEGTVDLVEPVYRAGASLVSVRVYLPNPGDTLSIGSRITAIVHAPPRSAWVVPATAVISTGIRQYVFTKEAGGFRAHEVMTGVRSGEWIEVRSGIGPLQAIARNAQLLVDSEGFLKATSP